ncbi:MAG: hypothetical protein OYL92_11710 [Acidobacteriota bacterium]|nr:hypothetical protein [Acidobacteriota bacterium]MDE2922668.1 hypothetical protein [Acidobacteriota bacterium]MDE3265625.1 hypothetical protein [Acidobacteriota bacterium]
MSRQSEARARAAALARRRDDVREAMADVRGALDRAGAPRLAALPGKGGAWVLPIAAGALGIAIAWSLRRFRNR